MRLHGLILGALGLFSAASAWAFPPDPAHSTCPDWLLISGKAVRTGAPPAGLPHPLCDAASVYTVVVNDVNSLPEPFTTVRIEIPCCDIQLCDSAIVCDIDGCREVHPDCATGTISGRAGLDGKLSFCIWGVAKDPGSQQVPPFAVLCDPGTAGHHCLYGGCGLHGARVVANSGTGDIELCWPTVVVFDLNGGADLVSSNGPTALDVSVEMNNVGAFLLPQPLHYRGRADQNCDGVLSGLDVALELGNVGRAALLGGLRCPGTKSCAGRPPCPNLDLP